MVACSYSSLAVSGITRLLEFWILQGTVESTEATGMATPQLLNDIVRLLIQVAPAMALVALVLAGIALRWEGGSNVCDWRRLHEMDVLGNCPRSVASTPPLVQFFGIPVQAVAGGVGTNWIAGIVTTSRASLTILSLADSRSPWQPTSSFERFWTPHRGATRCRRF